MSHDARIAPLGRFPAASTLLLLLLLVLATGAQAQTNEDERQGFTVRALTVSTGIASVQLPPITLEGDLPGAVLEEDVIASGTASIDWRRLTPRTTYALELFGSYVARARYPQLNAPAGNVAFGISRALGKSWRVGGGVATLTASSDQLAPQPTETRSLIDDAATFDDLAGAVAVARSPSPDPNHAALFKPISRSLDPSDIYLDRSMVSSVRAEATHAHSVRLTTTFLGGYTTTRQLSSRRDPAHVPLPADSTAQGAGVIVTYARSERTQVTAGLAWSQVSGASTDNVLIASAGYGWLGRKWFTQAVVGAALRPFDIQTAPSESSTLPSRAPTIVYSGAIGYKFRAQTLLVRYSRAPHDDYGHGGVNTTTGFAGDVQSLGGSWVWSAPRGKWLTRSDFTLVRRPGNFSYINAWLSTFSVGRQISPNVGLAGELLFDRHGSRMFEGFHMTREGVRVTLIWTPTSRLAAVEPSGQ